MKTYNSVVRDYNKTNSLGRLKDSGTPSVINIDLGKNGFGAKQWNENNDEESMVFFLKIIIYKNSANHYF